MMKKFYPVLFCFALLYSCSGFKEMPVEYDYSYRGNFKRYRTYDLMKPVGEDSTQFNAVIENAIISRMKFLGYHRSERRPHLLIGYKMYHDSLRFNGYNQPAIETWVKAQDHNRNYDPQSYNLSTGTLLIQFYDRRQNQSIWQGYATTSYGSIDFTSQRHLKNAVFSILDKYRFWAEGFVESSQAAADREFQ
jgi:hypothetical protein